MPSIAPLPVDSHFISRSSSNSLGRRNYGFGGAPLVGGSLRVHSSRTPYSYPQPAEQVSLLSQPPQPHRPPNPHGPPTAGLLLSRRDRRALSLELPELFRAAGQGGCPPPVGAKVDSGKRSRGSVAGASGTGSGVGTDHRDCNGKAPGLHGRLMVDVFPQVNARKERVDLDEESDYVSSTSQTKNFNPKCWL